MQKISQQNTFVIFSCCLIFIFNSIFLRILLPIGDEPDYWLRVVALGDMQWQPFWSPYQIWQDSLAQVISQGPPSCYMESSPMALMATIDSRTCTESFSRVMLRLQITFALVSPLIMLVFIASGMKASSMVKATFGHWETRLSERSLALALTLAMPSSSYYLGLLSHEQITLILSLPLIILWNSMTAIFSLTFLIGSFDLGNACVFIGFVLLGKTSLFSSKYFGQSIVHKFLVAMPLASLILGYSMVNFFSVIPFLEQQSSAIVRSMQTSDLLNKYPIFLRPVITYMTMIFSTPNNLKVPIVYLLFGAGLYQVLKRNKKLLSRYSTEKNYHTRTMLQEEKTLAMVGVSFILTVVFALPTYANAKYYIFILPFFIKMGLRVFSPSLIVQFIAMNSVLVHLHLILYRLL